MLPALYATTLFVGATLLFLVQPMIGKLLLPLVGGTPAVWNACMVFFQAVLLGGYLYAHQSTTTLGVRRQAVLHLALLLVVLLVFKIAIASGGSPVPVVATLIPADEDFPIFGVVCLLLLAVGVPFFVLSTTSPLLQRWFASSGHPSARDPYFLYAASNAGSLLGLLGYPLLLEPYLTLATQKWVWAIGVLVYLVLVLVCAMVVLRSPAADPERKSSRGKDEPPRSTKPDPASGSSAAESEDISGLRVWKWIGLSALPSSLLLGVTTHVSTELAPIPLLWAIPLALYLISFILVFANWPDRVYRLVGRITPMLLLFVVLTLVTAATQPLGLIAGVHMTAFFAVCLVCHGELARDRPPPQYLTAFYFWMSLGGVLGGTFNALIAPVLFHRVGMVEYPLALAVAGLVRPRVDRTPGPPLLVRDITLVLGLFGLAAGLVIAIPRLFPVLSGTDPTTAETARLVRRGLMFGLPAVVAYALVARPVRYALGLGALLVAGILDPAPAGDTLHMERNFFGVVRVARSADGKFVRLIHGHTVIGEQEVGKTEPRSYYHRKGPMGDLFAALPPDRPRRVGVVGLGTGSLASYARPGDSWVFFEIDPAIARIARDPQYFTYLSECPAVWDVVLGDARRQLARAPDRSFDLIILDAFSSDTVPAHLLTREALRVYISKLAPGGLLVLNVTNPQLDLAPLVARLAADHDPPLSGRHQLDQVADADQAEGRTESEWVILARAEADLAPAREPRWGPLPRSTGAVWRDDFANPLLVWKRKSGE